VGSRWVSALLAAAGCAIGLFWTWLIAFETDTGVLEDMRVFAQVVLHQTPWMRDVAGVAKGSADPQWFLVLVAGTLAVSLARGRWAVAVAVAVLIVGANATTQILQSVTTGTRVVPALPYAQWPSGHATAIVSLALGLLLSVPAEARRGATVTAVVATAVIGWAVVARHTHLPSDVLGAVFVSGFWASLVLAALLRYAPEYVQASS
jgi:membrane-associated phospholipid phosphatase